MEMITELDVNFELNEQTKEGVLKQLAQMAFERGKVSDADEFFKQLCLREEESTTGFGNGVAIPHARHDCVKEAGVLVVRLTQSVEWQSLDGEPVDVAICLIAPNNQDDFHLKVLSKLARKMIHEDFIEALRTKDEIEVIQLINEVIA